MFEENLEYVPYFKKDWHTCGSKLMCNGCSNCGVCDRK